MLTEFAPGGVAAIPYAARALVPLAPARLLDTRGGGKAGSFDGSAGPVVLNVLGKGGLPGAGYWCVGVERDGG